MDIGVVAPSVALDAFRGYQSRRGYTDATQRAYDQFLEPFVTWAGGRPLGELSAQEIELVWVEGWCRAFSARRGRPPAPRTVRNHLTSLRVFFGFLERFAMIEKNPMVSLDLPRVPRSQPDWLTPAEDTRMLAATRSPLECFLIPFLRWTGLRSAEARSVRWGDVRDAELWVRTSKTPEGVRAIPILEQLEEPLLTWQARQVGRGLGRGDAYVLATQTGTLMTHVQLWTSVKRVAYRGDVRRHADHDQPYGNRAAVSPHTLRRTFASDLLNRGVRLEVVSRLLGHSETRTTEHSYAVLLDSRIAMETRAAFRGRDAGSAP